LITPVTPVRRGRVRERCYGGVGENTQTTEKKRISGANPTEEHYKSSGGLKLSTSRPVKRTPGGREGGTP